MSAETEQYRERLEQHLDHLERQVLPVGSTVRTSTTLGIAPADLHWLKRQVELIEKAVAAQVLREFRATTIEHVDGITPCPCAPCRSLRERIDRFAEQHGIDLEGGEG